MSDTTSGPARSTAVRVFAVLSAFERSKPTMSLKEIAGAAGLPIATTFRITRELVALGALERNADGSMQVGLRLWQLGSLAPRQLQLRRVARPIMENLHASTGEVVQLAVGERNRAVCIEKISSPTAAFNVTEVSGRLPLHSTGVGKVILAFGVEEPSREIDELPLRRFTPRTIADPKALRDELQLLREEFVAYCREEMTMGTASVAAPVFGEDGRLVAALGLLTGSPHSLVRLAPSVRSAALEISRRLGYVPVSSVASLHPA